MLKLKKKQITILGALIILACLIYFPLSLSIKNKYNSISLDNVNIVDVDISEEDGIYKYSSTLIAVNDVHIDKINIVLKDSDNNIVDTLIGYVSKDLKEKDQYKIISSTDTDLSTVKNIEYTTN